MLDRLGYPLSDLLDVVRRLIVRAAHGEPTAAVIVLGLLLATMAIFYRLLRVKEHP
jgi:hypothetical protein